MNPAHVLAVVLLLWCCESVKGIDDDIFSCEIFQPANFNISIGKISSAIYLFLFLADKFTQNT